MGDIEKSVVTIWSDKVIKDMIKCTQGKLLLLEDAVVLVPSSLGKFN